MCYSSSLTATNSNPRAFFTKDLPHLFKFTFHSHTTEPLQNPSGRTIPTTFYLFPQRGRRDGERVKREKREIKGEIPYARHHGKAWRNVELLLLTVATSPAIPSLQTWECDAATSYPEQRRARCSKRAKPQGWWLLTKKFILTLTAESSSV